MIYSPIIVFAFNRPDNLRKSIDSLLFNPEAKESDLFVFVDGPRTEKAGENEKVQLVRDYVKNITGFKSLTYQFSKVNKKLGPSIIAGVTEVINEFGKAIIIEDDLVVTKNFLSFMNQGLELYKDNKRVFSICGYTNKVTRPANYSYDAYFCVRSSSWGWGTWKDRWERVDWELSDWWKHCLNKKKFCKWGGSDCWKMLEDWHAGRNQSWAIRFCYSQFLSDSVSLFPIISKVANEGFDGEGTNCKSWSRFKYDFDNSRNKDFLFPDTLTINMSLYKDAMSYHSLWKRAYSKIMYLIHS